MLCCTYTTKLLAQNRIKLTEYVTLVNCGDTYWLEDDKNQRSISISVVQKGIDKRNGQKLYNVVCGDFTRTVVKAGVKEAVKNGIKAAGVTSGSSLIVAAAGYATDKIYSGLCSYWGDSFK